MHMSLSRLMAPPYQRQAHGCPFLQAHNCICNAKAALACRTTSQSHISAIIQPWLDTRGTLPSKYRAPGPTGLIVQSDATHRIWHACCQHLIPGCHMDACMSCCFGKMGNPQLDSDNCTYKEYDNVERSADLCQEQARAGRYMDTIVLCKGIHSSTPAGRQVGNVWGHHRWLGHGRQTAPPHKLP